MRPVGHVFLIPVGPVSSPQTPRSGKRVDWHLLRVLACTHAATLLRDISDIKVHTQKQETKILAPAYKRRRARAPPRRKELSESRQTKTKSRAVSDPHTADSERVNAGGSGPTPRPTSRTRTPLPYCTVYAHGSLSRHAHARLRTIVPYVPQSAPAVPTHVPTKYAHRIPTRVRGCDCWAYAQLRVERSAAQRSAE